MSASTPLHDLVSRWELLNREGQLVTPETLCQNCPELLPAFKEHVARMQGMGSFLDQPTLPPTLPDAATLHAPTPEVAAASRRIPGYEILSELGRGGMGVVYQARQLWLNRIVAIKTILAGSHADAETLARFKAEARAVARLQHPNVVQIFEIGEHEAIPFLVLEFVPGGSLDKQINSTPQPSARAAQLVETLARTIHDCHEKGIIHRDLKPGNVLVTSDGVPKVTDFGLVKYLDGDDGRTRTGAVMGTPSYLAPEQAEGKSKHVGPRADVYALGAILYELLTGRPPFKAVTPLDTLLLVMECTPAPLRLLNPQVDRDLETICLKCLEKDPSHRYPSAHALAEDLRAYLAHDPITARSINVLERVTRTLQRSHIDAGYEAWGSILLCFAAIIPCVQLAQFAAISTRQHVVLINSISTLQFVAMALVVWRFHTPQLVTMNAAQKQVWTIWAAFVLTSVAITVVSQALVGLERMYDFFLYPYWTLLSGFAFLVMGAAHWGWLYVIGLVFLMAGIALAFYPIAGPFAFGFLWAVSLIIIGLKLRGTVKL